MEQISVPASTTDEVVEIPRTPQSTDSMITVRLSSAESLGPSHPRLSLKLVTDDHSTGPRVLTNPVVGVSGSSSTSSANSSPRSSLRSDAETTVDWAELERSEEQEPRDDTADESATFLLARLERENSRIVNDPKAARPIVEQKRPPSLHQLKKLMDNPDPATLRYSMLPSPPPLTDLDFYAALVNDYHRTAMKLPFLLCKKIRAGVPPPLRGVVWTSMSGARDTNLESVYDRLQGESSPYEHLIGKDLGRTFPGVDIFSTAGGEGQRMLGRVLRAFSVYDTQIGYCQGLGFLVGPLLMHMGEREAFCVLVRLMENYELRSCFLPNMYGLQLRLYQLSKLIAAHLPDLARHLDELGIQTEYATQWFLSFFAVTCPLPMLLRIYDVIFLEGAPETIMRVAMSLLRRNEARLLASREFEEVMQMLLARGLWDTYKCSADDLVNDFTGLTGIVTRESLIDLEKKFRKEHPEDGVATLQAIKAQETNVQAVASRFLGRFWTVQSPQRESASLSLSPLPAPSNSRPTSQVLRRTTSKQSLSTLNSFDGSSSDLGSIPTDATTMSRSSTDEQRNSNKSASSHASARKNNTAANKDNELHAQIEELLMAMSALQREHAATVDELQALQHEREEERRLSKTLVDLVRKEPLSDGGNGGEILEVCDALAVNLEANECPSEPRQSYKDVLEELERARERLIQETSRAKDLQSQLTEHNAEVSRLKTQVSDTRSRWQDSQREKQRLEKQVSDLKVRKDVPKQPTVEYDYYDASPTEQADQPSGLRSFKLNRTNSPRTTPSPPTSTSTYSKRSSSLGIQPLLQSTDNQAPPSSDALLLELVQAKTAEATARQEAEEAKAKLEAMRRMLAGSSTSSSPKPSMERSMSASGVYTPGQTTVITSMAPPQQSAQTAAAKTGFGSWTAWGRRSAGTAE